ncbi:MAG: hypothetical protein CMO55_01035 [Verrucomicrobiales bacterium]|nr:hypothetical protein [Verrucomicrobiales bacterium]
MKFSHLLRSGISLWAFAAVVFTPFRGQSEEENAGDAPVMRGFRLSTKTDEEEKPKEMIAVPKESNENDEETQEKEGPLKVGLVQGQSKLPPEVAEIAQEGALAVADQRWEEARRLYLQMIEKAPDNALAYANLGVAEHQLGNLLAAAGNLSKSLEINPTISQNWQTLGLIQYERGDLDLAISSLTRAIHESPKNARAHVYLAAVVRDYGWEDAALSELQQAIELDPGLEDAHYNLAVSYLDMNPPRIELARRHYYSAIDLGAEPSPEIEAVFAENQ